jgi:hypothetical protein
MDANSALTPPSSPPPIEFGCGDLMVRLDVRLPGDPAAITPVVESVLTMARQMKCAEGKEFEIETALREALANAIRYGCAHDPSREVQCAVACDQSRGMPDRGAERLLTPRAGHLPHQPADGRSQLRAWRHRDPHAREIAASDVRPFLS